MLHPTSLPPASGADRHLDITFIQIAGSWLISHPLFPYLLEKCLAIPTSPFFFSFSVTSCRNFRRPLTFILLVGGIDGWGGIKMASASTPSNEPAKYLILVHTVQQKPIIKAQISGKLVSSGISDVASLE